MQQEGEIIRVSTLTHGLSDEEGGYHWSGELRLWDNEILMGWYASTEGAIRDKGTMYFVLHPHGVSMAGRWVGLSNDGKDHHRMGVNGKGTRRSRGGHRSAEAGTRRA